MGQGAVQDAVHALQGPRQYCRGAQLPVSFPACTRWRLSEHGSGQPSNRTPSRQSPCAGGCCASCAVLSPQSHSGPDCPNVHKPQAS